MAALLRRAWLWRDGSWAHGLITLMGGITNPCELAECASLGGHVVHALVSVPLSESIARGPHGSCKHLL